MPILPTVARGGDGSRLPADGPAPTLVAAAVGALVALLWALHPLQTADLAAQAYRANLFDAEGFLLWDNNWYGGHYLPGYSLLFPPLGAAVGLLAAGLVLVPLAGLLFAEVLRAAGTRARGKVAAWFAVALLGELVIGRLTFLLGTTVALAAVLLLVRGRPRGAGAVAGLAAVASPVAGAFVLLAGAALVLEGRRRDGVLLAGGALVPLLVAAAVAPEGGVQPFSTLSLLAAAGLTLVFLLLTRRTPGVVRTGAWLYLAAVLACFVLPTPVGSNVVRLGVLFGGPLLLALRPVAGPAARLAVLCFVAYQAFGPVTEAAKSLSTPSRPSVYAALLGALSRAGADGSQRVEIIPTATRWEVVRVAGRFPLARGWESQLDRARNPLFFAEAPPDANAYRRWLDDNAVGFVVLPHVPLESSGRREARLVAQGLPYLRPVWHDARWTVLRVSRPTPLTDAPTRGARLTYDTLRFIATAPATVLARVRWTSHWRVVRGGACVRRDAEGRLLVTVTRPGRVVLAARWGAGTPCR